ncbi:Molybdenum cofactor sulfurase, partial [Linum grandiflorum]
QNHTRITERKGGKVKSAEFSWPRLRINSAKLKKMILSKNKNKKKKRGIFVFPLHSRMTGARYPYSWMRTAQENDWHLLIDACALGPKDLDSFALALIRPDFVVSSFYKIFGENPSGFGCLFVKKSTIPLMEDYTGAGMKMREGRRATSIVECRGLDQVDSLGLTEITNRGRWLVNALTKLKHPTKSQEIPLVRIYGPKVKFDRGPAMAFNVFDWKGAKIEPSMVQKLADRNNISLSYGFLHHISFSDKKKDKGIAVVTIALGFLSNFEDAYRLWAFIAQFLDADFVEKANWRYTGSNQKTIEV